MNKPSNKRYCILREKCLHYCNPRTYNDLSGHFHKRKKYNPIIKRKGIIHLTNTPDSKD